MRTVGLWILVGLVAGLLGPAPVLAEEGPRVAFIDLRKAVFSSRDGKAAQQEFARLEEKKLEDLRPMRDELQRLQEEVEKQKYLITEEALATRQMEIMKRRRDLERDIRAAEDDLQLEQVRLLQPIQKMVGKVVEELGKEKGFAMIVDKNIRGFVYTDKSLDVTELVVKKLNKK
ncbi:MAG: OmpH family outer membrane protein [Myxococcota bacterium]